MPILARFGDFPEVETEATLYTPDRSVVIDAMLDSELRPMGDPAIEMMVVHTDELELNELYEIGRRALRIYRLSDYAEFKERCHAVQRLMRPERYKFYLAIPE